MCAILRLTRINDREPKDAWRGINALCVLRTLMVYPVGRQGSDFMAQVVMYNCTV